MSGRYLPTLLEEIIEMIPEGEEMKRQLQHVYESAKYTAPEDMMRHWDTVNRILNSAIPLWKVDVVLKWMRKKMDDDFDIQTG